MYDDIFSALEHWSTGFHMRAAEEPHLGHDPLVTPESLLSLTPTDHDTGAHYPERHSPFTTSNHTPIIENRVSDAIGHVAVDALFTERGRNYGERNFDGRLPFASGQTARTWTSDAPDYQPQTDNNPGAFDNPYQTGEDTRIFAEEVHHTHHPREEPIEHDDQQADHDTGLLDKMASGHAQSMGHHFPGVFNPHPETPPIDHEGHNPSIRREDFQDGLHQSLGAHYTSDTLIPHVDQHPWEPENFHGIGHPAAYSRHWQQQMGEDCAVVAQGDILSSITGQHISEQQLCAEASSHHIYDARTGTHCVDLGKLLELHDVPTERIEDANFADLKQALQNNQRVLVGVNANEIWFPHRDTSTGEPAKLPYSGHAVWVTGIDPTPTGMKVILSDSGPEFGRIEAVALDDFLNAWHDTNNLMVITKHSYSPSAA